MYCRVDGSDPNIFRNVKCEMCSHFVKWIPLFLAVTLIIDLGKQLKGRRAEIVRERYGGYLRGKHKRDTRITLGIVILV